jgi:hypothetical protein
MLPVPGLQRGWRYHAWSCATVTLFDTGQCHHGARCLGPGEHSAGLLRIGGRPAFELSHPLRGLQALLMHGFTC